MHVRYTAAACLAEELGYALIATAWNMTADLTLDLDSAGDEQRLGFAAWGARLHWFGPMGTAESTRGLGFGAVLLRRCLRDLRANGARRAEIGWVGPKRFYLLTVGATVGRVFWQYGRDLVADRA